MDKTIWFQALTIPSIITHPAEIWLQPKVTTMFKATGHMYGFVRIYGSCSTVIHKAFSVFYCSFKYEFFIHPNKSVRQSYQQGSIFQCSNSKQIPGFKSTPKSDEIRLTYGKNKNPNKNTRSQLNKLSQHLIHSYKDSCGCHWPQEPLCLQLRGHSYT